MSDNAVEFELKGGKYVADYMEDEKGAWVTVNGEKIVGMYWGGCGR